MKRIKTISCLSFLFLSALIFSTTYTYAREKLFPRAYVSLREMKVSVVPQSDKVYYKEGQTATFDITITMTRKMTQKNLLPAIFDDSLQIVATFPDSETEVTLDYVSSGHDSWYYTYTTPPFRESGTPTLSVTASFKETTTGSASSTIRVDTLSPVITDISPSSDETRTEEYPIISCAYSDDLSGIDVNSVRLTVDEQDVTSSATITETNITYTPPIGSPLVYGLHQVNVEVTDNAGNSARATWSFETTERSINNPTIDPDSIDVGYPTLVTITAQIYPDKDLSEVKLLHVERDGQVIDILGYLSDDGQNGDAQAGDNLYTLQKEFTELDLEEIILQIVGIYTAGDSVIFSTDISTEVFSILFYLPVVLYPELEQLNLSGSLRLMTFNTQLKTTAFETGSEDVEQYYGMLNETRAGAIADQILAMEKKPDIIVFQEVFDEDARDALFDKLKGTYKHVVSKLAAADLDEDSGLMLFSLFPFAPLINEDYKANDVTAITTHWGTEKDWDEVAFIEYDDCDSWPDSMASKGVGLVRIWSAPPPNSKFLNIAFTHTEATYGSDTYEQAWESTLNRRCQMGYIKNIIQDSLNDVHRENEPIFVMGDFNINGNPKSMVNKWTGTKDYWFDYIQDNDDNTYYEYEWDYLFNRYLENSYFSTYFSDSWMYDTVSWNYDNVDSDPGQTHSGGDEFPFYYDDPTQGERLDYILHNNNEVMASATDVLPGIPKYVVQHIRRVWEPVVAPSQKYSDHLAVMADINLFASYCNPLIAYDVEVDPDTPDATIQNTIQYKGNMQWYRLDDQGGAYSIWTSPEVEFDVYEAKDLSRPIKITGEETRWGMQYTMPEVPFYIRVFASDSNPVWTGDYTIKIHLHLGVSKEDAILLDPLGEYEPGVGYGYKYQIPTTGGLEKVWFKIIPEWGYTGNSPSIKVVLDTINASFDVFDMDLTTDDEVVIAEAETVVPPYEEPYSQYIWEREQIEKTELPSKERYYPRVLIPDPTWSAGQVFVIRWQTSLTYFVSGVLRNYEQSDNDGDDHIYAYFSVDGNDVPSYWSNVAFDDGGEGCDESGTEMLSNFLDNYGFVDSLDIRLYENDNGTNLGERTIDTLPMNQRNGSASIKWLEEDPDDPCDPYWYYWMWGKLSHQQKK